MGLSLIDRIALLPASDQRTALSDPVVAQAIQKRAWWAVRRPEQEVPKGSWSVWLIQSGRGWGKTRTGAETLAEWIREQPLAPDGSPTEWAIIAEKYADARDICVEGPSGFLKCLTEDEKCRTDSGRDWNRSQGEIYVRVPHPTRPGDSVRCKIHVLGADNADVARGLNLAGAWLDELAKWPDPAGSWSEGIMPSLRIGHNPRVVCTTTPKPITQLIEWNNDKSGFVHITRGSMFDNAHNLSATAIKGLLKKYRGTRIGRQELYGELLEEVDGALWTRDLIEADRLKPGTYDIAEITRSLTKIVVAIDPAVTKSESSDETGIVIAGLGMDGHVYVLEDISGRYSPKEWAEKALDAYARWEADYIIGEVNNGGDLVKRNLHAFWELNPTVGGNTVPDYRDVRASRGTGGKGKRAQPVAALYEQHKVHHVGAFTPLEDQMVTWVADESDFSPDRMDALVWAITHLALIRKPPKKARRVRQ